MNGQINDSIRAIASVLASETIKDEKLKQEASELMRVLFQAIRKSTELESQIDERQAKAFLEKTSPITTI